MAGEAVSSPKSKNRKVIITCAVTGSVHTPSMTAYLPITSDEIARESIIAAEGGASVIHLHARDAENGRPTHRREIIMKFLPRIRQNGDAVSNITTGGSRGMSIEDRIAAPLRAQPELCSLNLGSMNIGIANAGANIKDRTYDGENPCIEKTRDSIYPGVGTPAKSNAEQVPEIRCNLAELSLDVATLREARPLFRRRGSDCVAF
jgi:uncharacterized protein (DUF849 family)